jgi:hypothetical protein
VPCCTSTYARQVTDSNGSGSSQLAAQPQQRKPQRLTHICSAVALSYATVTVDADSNAADPKNSRACKENRGCDVKPEAAECMQIDGAHERASQHSQSGRCRVQGAPSLSAGCQGSSTEGPARSQGHKSLDAQHPTSSVTADPCGNGAYWQRIGANSPRVSGLRPVRWLSALSSDPQHTCCHCNRCQCCRIVACCQTISPCERVHSVLGQCHEAATHQQLQTHVEAHRLTYHDWPEDHSFRCGSNLSTSSHG